MKRSFEQAPPTPFAPEVWRRMVELVNFLRVPEARPEVQDRLGEAIVRLRLRQCSEQQQERASTKRDRR